MHLQFSTTLIFGLSTFLGLLGCKEQMKLRPETQAAEISVEQSLDKVASNKSIIQKSNLPKTVSEWEAFQALIKTVSAINDEKYNVLEGSDEALVSLFTELKNELPEAVNIPSIATRFKVLETMAYKLKVDYNINQKRSIEFKKTIDSLQLNEIKQLNKFSSGATTPSKLFKQVALSTVNYIFDSKKEAYRFIDFNNSEKKYPENFYDFRKNIDYNDSLFEEFYQYYNFLFPHFDNLAYEKFIKLYNKRSFTKDNIDYNLIKLELIDSLVANREIKSRLTSFITRKFLSFSKTQDEATLIYNYYLEINKTKDNDSKNYQQKRVINLYNNLKKLKKGNKLPIIELINTSKSSININKLINNKTIIYFWSKNSKNSYKYSHNKVKDLKKNHPDIDFISVNIDKISTEKWLSKLKTNASYCTCIDCKTDVAANEFKLRNVDIAKMLLGIQYIRKTIVVDSNMNIIESNVNLFSDNLDEIID